LIDCASLTSDDMRAAGRPPKRGRSSPDGWMFLALSHR
jgi:hypothetical protein